MLEYRKFRKTLSENKVERLTDMTSMIRGKKRTEENE